MSSSPYEIKFEFDGPLYKLYEFLEYFVRINEGLVLLTNQNCDVTMKIVIEPTECIIDCLNSSDPRTAMWYIRTESAGETVVDSGDVSNISGATISIRELLEKCIVTIKDGECSGDHVFEPIQCTSIGNTLTIFANMFLAEMRSQNRFIRYLGTPQADDGSNHAEDAMATLSEELPEPVLPLTEIPPEPVPESIEDQPEPSCRRYLPQRPETLERWKQAWQIYQDQYDEYLYDGTELDYASIATRLADQRIWPTRSNGPSETTIRRILRCGKAGLLE